MNRIAKIIVIASIITGLLLLSSMFTIMQGQKGMVLRLGRLIEDAQTGKTRILLPGLHFKLPFIETVRVFDTRLLTLAVKSSRIVTKEKYDVIVDYYVKWRIEDLGQYFKATGGIPYKAQTLLEQQLNTSLRAQFGKRTIAEMASTGRDDVMALLRDRAERQASKLGIHVVDVRIKGIDLPANTSNNIYQTMRADMQKIANRYRADGDAAKIIIKAEADAEVLLLDAEAKSQAQSIRSGGQAKASSIYAEAFGQNKEFFAIYRNFKAYEASFKSKADILVLDPKMAFFNYFFQGQSHSALPKVASR